MAVGFIIIAEVLQGPDQWRAMYYCGQAPEPWTYDENGAKVYQYVGWANARRDCFDRKVIGWVRKPRVCRVQINVQTGKICNYGLALAG